MGQVHELKCWSEFFKEIKAGKKKHELRINDRKFEVGDRLILWEYDPNLDNYTGNWESVYVTYITSFDNPCAAWQEALNNQYCIMSIEKS